MEIENNNQIQAQFSQFKTKMLLEHYHNLVLYSFIRIKYDLFHHEKISKNNQFIIDEKTKTNIDTFYHYANSLNDEIKADKTCTTFYCFISSNASDDTLYNLLVKLAHYNFHSSIYNRYFNNELINDILNWHNFQIASFQLNLNDLTLDLTMIDVSFDALHKITFIKQTPIKIDLKFITLISDYDDSNYLCKLENIAFSKDSIIFNSMANTLKRWQGFNPQVITYLNTFLPLEIKWRYNLSSMSNLTITYSIKKQDLLCNENGINILKQYQIFNSRMNVFLTYLYQNNKYSLHDKTLTNHEKTLILKQWNKTHTTYSKDWHYQENKYHNIINLHDFILNRTNIKEDDYKYWC